MFNETKIYREIKSSVHIFTVNQLNDLIHQKNATLLFACAIKKLKTNSESSLLESYTNTYNFVEVNRHINKRSKIGVCASTSLIS